jgi:hypothetical protein
MDARVKPAHDEEGGSNLLESALPARTPAALTLISGADTFRALLISRTIDPG